ncbi:hypothetical protein DRJ48_05325 [Candidatus Woesearchaeota archaeon]|nr:hypothetical protein [Candidatus Woesearchaeota archaeon]RLE41560.1 MAG: hypothetical protein DRJ48_05325 [Candidatus Woesearchaeota archaeon]
MLNNIKIGFLLKSPVLSKLQPPITKATKILADALRSRGTIIIRHHGDCDGYCGGMAIEEGLLQLARSFGLRNEWQLIQRHAMRSPQYDIEYASSDINTMNKFGNKKGLVVLVDTGSTEDAEPGLALLKQYNIDTIIVDHHPCPLKKESMQGSKLRTIHLNPYLVGFDSRFTAGMLGVEVARALYPLLRNQAFLAALSGIGDKVDGTPLNGYLRLANSMGYTKDYIWRAYVALDYLLYLRREPSVIVRDLLLGSRESQDSLIGRIYPISQERREKRIAAMKRLLRLRKFGGRLLAQIELGELFEGYSYPPPGRSIGLLYEELCKQHNNPVVMGIGSNYIIFRGKLPQELSIETLIASLRERLPDVEISGGGHEVAGTLWFLPADKGLVLELVDDLFGFKK